METEIITIKAGQYLKDIMEYIPENAIIRKTLPGIGATYLEITSKRNSIIVEPNVPVIEGKQKKHPEILGVIGGVTIKHITDYLKSEVEFKKIITTPESYYKLQEAFRQLRINYFEDYFFLFDECERLIQDIDYRPTIDAPMEDFWKFKCRSFISATPIQPSDSEFHNQGFKNIVIKPDFEYKQDITIYKTYNVLAMIKQDAAGTLSDKEHIEDTHCYFVNSVDMIHCIIRSLEIKDISNIYSSEDSVKSFQSLGYVNTFSSLTPLNKFNFFTSRFYSAVDIDHDTKPHVTIVTEVIFAPHSMVLPQTEVIQIVGRFRNGVKSVLHITNVNSFSPLKSIDDVKREISETAGAYETIKTLFRNSILVGEKAAFKEMIEHHSYTQLLSSDRTSVNWFKYQNKLLDQLVNNTYHDLPNLLKAFQDSNFFNTTEIDFHNYSYDDKRYFQRANSNKREMRKDIVNQLDSIDLSVIDDNIYEIESLEREDQLIVDAYLKLGKEFIERVKYNENDLKIALIKKSVEDGVSSMPIMDAILDTFIVDRDYTEKEIKSTLSKIYKTFDLEKGVSATDLSEYFDLSPRKTIHGRKGKDGMSGKGYKILSAKYSKMDPKQKTDLFNQDLKTAVSEID